MRITRENVEELASLLDDLETAMSDIADPVTTWIDAQDDSEMREERREARDEIDDNIGALEEAAFAVVELLAPKRVMKS